MVPHRFKIAVSLFLILATFAVFWQVSNHDFVSYDDDTYLTKNPHVQARFSRESITWAFTTTYANFWHPLTWLSHMLDYQLFGLNPGRHHLSSLLLHIANSILLFLVFVRMTRARWCSAFVAALFALHPHELNTKTPFLIRRGWGLWFCRLTSSKSSKGRRPCI